jgi:hypothetical protein
VRSQTKSGCLSSPLFWLFCRYFPDSKRLR